MIVVYRRKVVVEENWKRTIGGEQEAVGGWLARVCVSFLAELSFCMGKPLPCLPTSGILPQRVLRKAATALPAR